MDAVVWTRFLYSGNRHQQISLAESRLIHWICSLSCAQEINQGMNTLAWVRAHR